MDGDNSSVKCPPAIELPYFLMIKLTNEKSASVSAKSLFNFGGNVLCERERAGEAGRDKVQNVKLILSVEVQDEVIMKLKGLLIDELGPDPWSVEGPEIVPVH